MYYNSSPAGAKQIELFHCDEKREKTERRAARPRGVADANPG